MNYLSLINYLNDEYLMNTELIIVRTEEQMHNFLIYFDKKDIYNSKASLVIWTCIIFYDKVAHLYWLTIFISK